MYSNHLNGLRSLLIYVINVKNWKSYFLLVGIFCSSWPQIPWTVFFLQYLHQNFYSSMKIVIIIRNHHHSLRDFVQIWTVDVFGVVEQTCMTEYKLYFDNKCIILGNIQRQQPYWENVRSLWRADVVLYYHIHTSLTTNHMSLSSLEDVVVVCWYTMWDVS